MNELSRIIGFDPQLIFDAIITGINVLILFALLSYLLFEPARKMLDGRREKIKKELSEAEEKLKAAEDMKAEYENNLKEAKDKVNAMLEEARANAKILSEDIVEKAKLEAKAIIERGNKEISLEKEKAMDNLKSEVVTISTMIASKIIKETVDEKKADALFNETMELIEGATWQG